MYMLNKVKAQPHIIFYLYLIRLTGIILIILYALQGITGRAGAIIHGCIYVITGIRLIRIFMEKKDFGASISSIINRMDVLYIKDVLAAVFCIFCQIWVYYDFKYKLNQILIVKTIMIGCL